MKYLYIIILLTVSLNVNALEVDYQKKWCPNAPGTTIRDLLTGRVVGYVDCLTDSHAWEFDFAKSMKQYEAIGQALKYSMYTGRRAGIVFIADDPDNNRYIEDAKSIIEHFNLPIDVETMLK